jgi:hypothetical protein
MIPTADFDSFAPIVLDLARLTLELRFVGEEQIEDGLGVGLHVAFEAAEALVDG